MSSEQSEWAVHKKTLPFKKGGLTMRRKRLFTTVLVALLAFWLVMIFPQIAVWLPNKLL